MPRFLVALAILIALATQANAAGPTCPSGPNPPNTPACAPQAVLPPQTTDLLWLQQATGPTKSNQMVGIPLNQLTTAGGVPGGPTNSIQINLGGSPATLGGVLLGANQLLVGTSGAPVAMSFTPYVAGVSGGVSGTFLAQDGTFQIPPSVSGGNVSNSGTPTVGQTAQWLNATTIQGINNTGSGLYVLQTAPTLITPNLGTPSVLVGTNISGVGAAFTAGQISGQAASATVDTTNANNISSGTLPLARFPNVNDEICYTGDSLTSEAAATSTLTLPWTSGTFTKLVGQTSGASASFSAQLQIGTTPVTGCTSLVVNSTTPVVTTCTAANTWSSINQPVSLVVGAPTNVPTAWSVCAIMLHSPT
jgi:hypothetical protein